MRGQIFSADFSVALFIFIALLSLAWYAVSAASGGRSEPLSEANKISDYVVGKRFGDGNFLECSPLTAFAEKSYSEQKKEFGADFFVGFGNKTKVCDGKKINLGFNFTNRTDASSVVRIVLVESEKISVNVIAYG